jgi:hypothetical protein
MVTVGDPAVVGVPVMTPLEESVKAFGRPLLDHVNPPVPPEAVIVVCGYSTPAVPMGNEAVVIEGAGLIVTVYVCDPVSRRAATEAVTVNV